MGLIVRTLSHGFIYLTLMIVRSVSPYPSRISDRYSTTVEKKMMKLGG